MSKATDILESERSPKRRIGEKGERVLSRVEKVASHVGKLVTKKQPSEIYKFGRQLSPHLMATVTGTKVQKVGKKSSRGRGRPSGTYKLRVLPSGKRVKVPTHIYKKMLSAEKSQMRLAKAQQMAQAQMQADQMAMQQDPRYQPSAEDQFLAEPDQQHEMEVMIAQQRADMAQQQGGEQQYQPQRLSVGRRVVDRLASMRGSGRGYTREYGQPQSVSPYGARQVQPLYRPELSPRGLTNEPRVTAVSGKANLLRVSNNFQSNPEHSMLTENRNINFFSNKQPIRVPDRSKLIYFNKERRRLY